MSINHFLTGFGNKDNINKNLLFSNAIINKGFLTTKNSNFSSLNFEKINNIDNYKNKYGFIYYTSSKDNLEKANKKKLKYLKHITQKSTKNEPKKLKIINDSKNYNRSVSISNNIYRENFQYEKPNLSFFNTGNITLITNKEDNENTLIQSTKNKEFNKINFEDFNIDDNKRIDSNKSFSEIKGKQFKSIFPIAKRIYMLKNLKNNIDKIKEENNKRILKNLTLIDSFTSINSNNDNQKNNSSLFDEVFHSNFDTPRSLDSKLINTPNLIRTQSKPKPKIPYYDVFMKQY